MITHVHVAPPCNPSWTAVHAPQLRLDFTADDGTPIGHAIVLDMSGMAFVLWIRVLNPRRGHGRAIHLELIRRYGAVACETFCSEDEWMCLRSLRQRAEVVVTKEPGPTIAGRPAIYRYCTAVERMFVCRLAAKP